MTAHREYLERVIEAAEKFRATTARLRQEMDEARATTARLRQEMDEAWVLTTAPWRTPPVLSTRPSALLSVRRERVSVTRTPVTVLAERVYVVHLADDDSAISGIAACGRPLTSLPEPSGTTADWKRATHPTELCRGCEMVAFGWHQPGYCPPTP